MFLEVFILKSIKPGRGPSALGVVSSIIVAMFGIFWTVVTIQMGAPIFFSLFGVVFVVMAGVQAVYNYKNATGKNRMSLFDITEGDEETDPVDKYIKHEKSDSEHSDSYCPYCGGAVKSDFQFCPKCGKQIKE